MSVFMLRIARRAPDGSVGLPVHEIPIEASSPGEAGAQAKRTDIDMIGLDANAIYVSDDLGRVFWSLRLRDVTGEG